MGPAYDFVAWATAIAVCHVAINWDKIVQACCQRRGKGPEVVYVINNSTVAADAQERPFKTWGSTGASTAASTGPLRPAWATTTPNTSGDSEDSKSDTSEATRKQDHESLVNEIREFVRAAEQAYETGTAEVSESSSDACPEGSTTEEGSLDDGAKKGAASGPTDFGAEATQEATE